MQICSGLDVSIVSKNVLKGSAMSRVFPRNGFAHLSRLEHREHDGKKFIGCVSKTSEPPTQTGFLGTIGILRRYAVLPLVYQRQCQKLGD